MTGFPIWYELMAPDPDAVGGFYRAVLGWEVATSGPSVGSGNMEYRAIQRRDGGTAGGMLKLSQDMLDHGATPGWLPYFDVADVDAAAAQVKDLGGTVFMGPRTIDVGRMAMVSDPQGAPFYLMTPVPPPDRPDAQSDVFKPNAPGHCWWNELETTDEPAATAFYTGLFGWSAANAMPMGDRGVYRFVEHRGQAVGAINPWMPEYMRVCWLPYFGVPDIEAARDAARSSGGSVTHDVHEVPGGDFIFTATDPAGAHVGFVGPKGA